MKLEIRTEGVRMTSGLDELIRRKIHFALARFESNIQSVRVRLTDVNGPRKGEDIQCHVQVNLVRHGVLTVEEKREDPFSSVAHAFHRMGRQIARRMDRLHTVRKGRRQMEMGA